MAVYIVEKNTPNKVYRQAMGGEVYFKGCILHMIMNEMRTMNKKFSDKWWISAKNYKTIENGFRI
ncbi:hypothetical protein ABD71_24330 [Brevibacillus laterosporus]|nr:hypothetical protein [Brevibacillus laterosporus]